VCVAVCVAVGVAVGVAAGVAVGVAVCVARVYQASTIKTPSLQRNIATPSWESLSIQLSPRREKERERERKRKKETHYQFSIKTLLSEGGRRGGERVKAREMKPKITGMHAPSL